MDGYYGLDDYLDSWDRRMNDLTEEEQNRIWGDQMYGRNGHWPPTPRKAEPATCSTCGTRNERPEPDGAYCCYVCEYQWEENESWRLMH